MSTQAETAFRILIRLYVEFDQRSGWAKEAQVVKLMELKEGISAGRSNDAIRLLKSLKMVETRTEGDKPEIKISSYGVDWMDKTCPLESRHPTYSFSMPMFGAMKLIGPDKFYGRSKASQSKHSDSVDWGKWGAIAGIVAVPIAILTWWFS